jgi:6-pyruvoyl-tetrahydropterin synthase
MVIDFGKLKNEIGSFIDMFDHSVHLWKEDENKQFFIDNNERYLILPCNPTAENYAVLFRDCINELLDELNYNNREGFVHCVSVRYHETDTGYAESTDLDKLRYKLQDITYSNKTIEETTEQLKTIFRRKHICE